MKMRVEHRWNDTDWGTTEVPGEEPVPVPLCSLQVSDGLMWDRTWTSAVRGRRLSVPLHGLS